MTPTTDVGIFVAAFPEGLDGFTRRVEETTLETAGFGGDETAGWVAVCGMLSLGAPTQEAPVSTYELHRVGTHSRVQLRVSECDCRDHFTCKC